VVEGLGTPEPETVVVGVDGSAASDRALAWALDYARQVGALVRMVTVWHFPTLYQDIPPNWDPESSATSIQKKALESVGGLAEGIPIESKVRSGWPADVLIDESESADLLVLGARGHSPIARALLGSTCLHCASHSLCSVMIVRP